MRGFKIGLVLAAALLLGGNAMARDTSGGCGLGWEVNGDESFLGTMTRGTTHATLAPTFSMTFGTSGCSRHSIVKNEAKGKHFTEVNHANLMIELSLGQGEYVAGYAEVMGCAKAEKTFGQVMQKNYKKIFPTDQVSPMEIYDNVRMQIITNKELASSCNAI